MSVLLSFLMVLALLLSAPVGVAEAAPAPNYVYLSDLSEGSLVEDLGWSLATPPSQDEVFHLYGQGRLMFNLRNDVLVKAQPNADGYHEIVWVPVISMTDGDPDGVYFAGDTLSFDVLTQSPNAKLRVRFGLSPAGEGVFLAAPVISGLGQDEEGCYLDVTTDGSGRFSVSGEVTSELPFGVVGIWLPDSAGIRPLPGPQGFVTVGIPLVYGNIYTNFAEITNFFDYNETVVLSVPDIASISLPRIAPFIVVSALFVQDFTGDVSIAMEFDEGQKAFSVMVYDYPDLATIRLFGVAAKLGITGMTADNFRQHLTVLVYDDDDELVADASSYFDIAQASYDPDSDILTLPVNHFSTYVVTGADPGGDTDPGGKTDPGGNTDLDGKADTLPATGTNLYGLLLLAILLVGGGTLLLRRHLIVR